MKKVLAVFLPLVMTFSAFAASAAAANARVKYPIIFIAGSSVDLVDADGNPVSTGIEVLTDDDDGGDGMGMDKIMEATMNILTPFVTEGLLHDEWDNYGNALYEELAPIWDEGQLDGDGNTKYGIGVSASEIERWDNIAATVDHGKDGTFGYGDYKFRYDWRLSPYDHVDRLHEYIKTILSTTKCEKVCLVGRCLGGNVVTAYLDKYGSEGLVAKVVYDEVMSNGSTTVNDSFCGKIKFSDKHIQAYLLESEHFGKDDIGIDLRGVNALLLDAVKKAVDYAVQSGALQVALGGIERLYEKVAEAFMPAMLRATGLATWPSYWTSLCVEDFDTAVNLIFGEEGSEVRQANAGLVEKILYLKERIVIPRTYEGSENLYKKFEKEYGVEIGILAGYGLLQGPITESSNDTGDCTVDLKSASFGATAAGVFDTLSDEYITERTTLGYGDYISADRKVDASTCLFPDTTWIIKNKHHDTMTGYYIIEKFCQYGNFTVSNNYKGIDRFLVASLEKYANDSFENMTEYNCADGYWITDVNQNPTPGSKLDALIDCVKVFLKLISELFNGNISLDF